MTDKELYVLKNNKLIEFLNLDLFKTDEFTDLKYEIFQLNNQSFDERADKIKKLK
jgi:hypothetical protein